FAQAASIVEANGTAPVSSPASKAAELVAVVVVGVVAGSGEVADGVTAVASPSAGVAPPSSAVASASAAPNEPLPLLPPVSTVWIKLWISETRAAAWLAAARPVPLGPMFSTPFTVASVGGRPAPARRCGRLRRAPSRGRARRDGGRAAGRAPGARAPPARGSTV